MSATNGPLAWMRVVDLTDLRGALCGRILADLGADVLQVQRSGTGPPDPQILAHRYRNANKGGTRLDPTADRDQLDALLADADVLIENFRPADRSAARLDPADVARAHPHLVHVALTDFGLTGPRADWHLEPLPALAASGTLHASGFPDLPPCAAPGHLAHDCASVYGAVGALAAVLDRNRHGRGQVVDVSAQEAGLAGTNVWSICLEDYTRINPFLPAAGTRNADGSYWVLPAKDGWIRTVIGSPRQWDGFVALLRDQDVLTGPEWSDPAHRLMNVDAIRMLAEDGLADRTRQELFDEALGLGTTVGVLLRPSEFVEHPQTRSRNFFTPVDLPDAEGVPMATFPMKLSATPATLRRPAPGPDARDGFAARPDTPPPVPLAGELLLEGVRVVEIGTMAVVPEMAGVLSELGAEVIRIESAAHPDGLRFAGSNGRLNQAFAFNAENRGSKSVTLDLTTGEGRDLALRLCASADVVAENQRGGVVDRLGLGYEHVRAVKPDVVYASSQGYGRGGPLGEMPAYGPLNSGFAGVHLLWNHPDAPYPCGTSLNHPDHIAGKLLAVAVLAALDHRQRTGEGQHIDMAQTETAAYFVGEVFLAAALTGVDPGAIGNRHPHAAPHGVYPAAGDDRWVAVAVHDDDAWQRVVALLGWDDDPALRTVEGRIAAHDALDERLAAWTREHEPTMAAALLQEAGVSAMHVMGPADHHVDEHLAERGFIVSLEHPEVGTERHVGNPVRLSQLRQRTATSSPCLGADTTQVLRDVLGLADDELSRLDAAGVLR
ncbi:MAG: CoA transferase [Ilumatobacter sp.]|nr:MAG: CoA transferase [Ilumatobacter sp.]